MRSQKIREQAECGSREIHGGGTERGVCRSSLLLIAAVVETSRVCVGVCHSNTASIPLNIKLWHEMTLMSWSCVSEAVFTKNAR